MHSFLFIDCTMECLPILCHPGCYTHLVIRICTPCCSMGLNALRSILLAATRVVCGVSGALRGMPDHHQIRRAARLCARYEQTFLVSKVLCLAAACFLSISTPSLLRVHPVSVSNYCTMFLLVYTVKQS